MHQSGQSRRCCGNEHPACARGLQEFMLRVRGGSTPSPLEGLGPSPAAVAGDKRTRREACRDTGSRCRDTRAVGRRGSVCGKVTPLPGRAQNVCEQSVAHTKPTSAPADMAARELTGLGTTRSTARTRATPQPQGGDRFTPRSRPRPLDCPRAAFWGRRPHTGLPAEGPMWGHPFALAFQTLLQVEILAQGHRYTPVSFFLVGDTRRPCRALQDRPRLPWKQDPGLEGAGSWQPQEKVQE